MAPLFYFGNIAYWQEILLLDKIDFALNQSIPKKSYSNRTIIYSANGLQTLTVPIQGGRGARTFYQDIEISYAENWISKHKMALLSSYSKSPFYEYYADYFISILDKKHEKLVDLNTDVFHQILKILKHTVDCTIASEPSKLISSYIPNEFDQSLQEYPQVYRYKFPFQPDLSILDLIFCMGNRSRGYLEG